MPSIDIKSFKGLDQRLTPYELPQDHALLQLNLDSDNPVGDLTLRGGFTKKYTDVLTDIISAYEYEYPTSGDTILLFNDNGTLKYLTNGAAIATPSLPSGATLEANFRNQYFGFKDRIIVTTGNAATTYVLGLYYMKRVNASNTGLFGNNEQFTGYKMLKSQLIPTNGTFSRVYRAVYHTGDSHYYFSFKGSKWIEKRDSSFRFVSRFVAHPNASAGATISLDSDGTNIFMGVSDATGSQDGFYRIDPDGWVVEEFENIADVVDVAVDDVRLYVVQGTPSSALKSYTKGNFGAGVDSSDSTSFDGLAVACFNSGGSHIYTIRDASGTPTVERRDETAVSTVTHTYNTLTNADDIECTTNVWVTDHGAGNIKELDAADITLSNTYTHANEPDALVTTASDGLKIISEHDGLMVDDATATLYQPGMFSLNAESINGSGSLATGTYFYKASLVDTDGQEYNLTDPIVVTFSAVSDVDIHIIVNESQLDDFYRVQSINVYRAFNSTQDAEAPATNYKLLKTIDINDAGWANNSTLSFYYYDFEDTTTEANISSVTYEENTGFNENTKPRYLNYKVHTWINNQLHCANFNHDGDTYKNRIAKGQVNGPDVLALDNTYDFDIYDGDEIKNLTTAYSRAYIFKQRKTGIFYQDVLERRLGQGIMDTDAYLTEVDTIYIMSSSGIYEINGANIKLISDKVVTYFNAYSSATDANIFLRDDRQQVIFSFPNDFCLVWNRKYDMWTSYTAAYAFQGYFKNLDDEYIGFGDNPNNSNQYFHHLDDATSDDTVAITVAYETPLLKLDDGSDGLHAELTKLHYRQKSTGSFVFLVYDWRNDSKATAATKTITDLTTVSTNVQHFEDIWGESFSIAITGNGTVFQLSSMTLRYVPAGVADEVHP